MKIYKIIKVPEGENMVAWNSSKGDMIYEITFNIVSDINRFKNTFDKALKRALWNLYS